MKKVRILSGLLLIVSTILFVTYFCYEKIHQDHVPPVIHMDENVCTVSVDSTDVELLKGVTASDDRSGDVTDSLVVENISTFTEDGKRVIIYAAADQQGNVGRLDRTLEYVDYQRPHFYLNAPLRLPAGKQMDFMLNVGADSVLDGDITQKIKYSLTDTINLNSFGKYPVEFRVTDSAGNTSYLSTIVEVYDEQLERIKVDLNKYLVYIQKGDAFDPQQYFKGSNEEGELAIQSDVDPEVPGVYHVDYVLENESSMGRNRLVVIVEEN